MTLLDRLAASGISLIVCFLLFSNIKQEARIKELEEGLLAHDFYQCIEDAKERGMKEDAACLWCRKVYYPEEFE